MKPPPAEIRAAQTEKWLQDIRAIAKPGHWLVIRGYKDSDNFIVMHTNIPLSHVAVYDPENDQVIEAILKGVVTHTLEYFVNHSHRVLIIEPKWWTATQGEAAVVEARELIGRSYDVTGLVGIDSDKNFYCSELAFHLYREQHSDHEHIPRVIEPGQMYLWGKILWDSGTRD